MLLLCGREIDVPVAAPEAGRGLHYDFLGFYVYQQTVLMIGFCHFLCVCGSDGCCQCEEDKYDSSVHITLLFSFSFEIRWQSYG